jgi:hypothetical protein
VLWAYKPNKLNLYGDVKSFKKDFPKGTTVTAVDCTGLILGKTYGDPSAQA